MRLTLILLFLQLWGNVQVSLSQDVKPCGLPDDTPNGYYQIIHGEGFVVGTTIKYFCNEGYHMVSMHDTRTCFLGKWTNQVPVCGVKACQLPEDTPNGYYQIIHGEGFVAGTTIKYFCNEGYQMLSTHDTRTCSLGNWTNHVPVCDYITCKVEVIHTHLNVIGLPPANETMKTGHRLQFQCNEQYVWEGSDEIECLQIQCTISILFWYAHFILPAFLFKYLCGSFPTCGAPANCGRPPYLPDGDIEGTSKFVYAHGESVKYICQNLYEMAGEPYKICHNGQWTGKIRCLKPCTVNEELMRNHNIEFKYSHETKLYAPHNDRLQFQCVGRTRHDGRVSMLQSCLDGVINLPTCHSIKCSVPDIENGRVIGEMRDYNEHEVLYYECNKKYTQIICDRLEIPNADISYPNKMKYKTNEQVNYVCNEGYKGNPTRICGENGWVGNSQCTGAVGCGPPPFLADGDVKYETKSQYSHNERAEYMCQMYYTMEGEPYTTCINGTWTGLMRCLKPCVVNEDDIRQHNISLKSSNNKFFTHDELVEFRCARGTPVGAVAMRSIWACLIEENVWQSFCHSLTTNLGNSTLGKSIINKAELNIGSEADSVWRVTPDSSSQTINMRFSPLVNLFVLWQNVDLSLSQNEPAGCENPPPLINGDIKYSMKSQYSHNESVEYTCQSYHIMQGEPYRTCINGKWIGQLRCLKPCTVNDHDMRQRNIEFKYNNNRKMYATHDDSIEFQCAKRTSDRPLRQKCNDGVILLPSCH
uniref:complement factor H-related protein 4-like n=1 Tax=Scatophagus argus TaxID=75038 RepID=UPI001ED7D3B8|nr:complement factor H-related protein 4-like [Scatophagus argus]